MNSFTVEKFLKEIEHDGSGRDDFVFHAIRCYFENGSPTKKLDELGAVFRIDIDEKNEELCCITKDFRTPFPAGTLTLREVRRVLETNQPKASKYEVVASEVVDLSGEYTGRVDTKAARGIAWNQSKSLFSLVFMTDNLSKL